MDSRNDLCSALMAFAPKPGYNALEISLLWTSTGFPKTLAPHKWSFAETVAGTIENGLLNLAKRFSDTGITPSPMARGALLIPNGHYPLSHELDLGPYPYFDLYGESKEGVVISYNGSDRKATIYARQTQSIIAHMTVARHGNFPMPNTGLDVRYAIHDNGGPTTPVARFPIFIDLDCKTDPETWSTGIGTGFCSGSRHIYANVNADRGFFCHNADDVRQSWEERKHRTQPAGVGDMWYLNCTAGAGNPAHGLLYWNTGSGTDDTLLISGGQYSGWQHGIKMIDFGPPFPGQSETKLITENNPSISGGTTPVSITEKTIWSQL